MQTVKFNTKTLLEKIKTNREAHRGIFLKAQVGYREDVIAELDKMIQEAKEGKQIRRGITLPEPQDHTTDYDRAVTMLEMSVDEVTEISSTEFDWYMMDNWGWKAAATASNMRYIK